MASDKELIAEAKQKWNTNHSGNTYPHVPLKHVNETVSILEKKNAKVQLKVYDGRPHTISKDEIENANWVIFKII